MNLGEVHVQWLLFIKCYRPSFLERIPYLLESDIDPASDA